MQLNLPPPEAALRASVVDICGDLRDGNFDDLEGKSYALYLGDMSADRHRHFMETLNAEFAFDPVCLRHVKINSNARPPLIILEDEAQVEHDEGRPIKDIKASNCEAFVDKVASEYVFHQFSPFGSYSTQNLHFFVKVLPWRLDGAVKAVRFYGYDQNAAAEGEGDVTTHFTPIVGSAWLKAVDYYEVVVGMPRNVDRHGAFYLETKSGTRYWINPADGSSNFVVNKQTLIYTEARVSWYGQRVENSNGAILEAPPAVALDVGSLPKAADSLTYFNPDECR